MLKFSFLSVEFSRIARFGVVGVLATLVYMTVTFIAVELFGLAAVAASIIGQCTSTLVSYLGHAFYSFGVETDHRTYLWRFLAVAAITFALNGLVTYLLTDVVGVSYRVSIICVSVLIPLTNYICNRFWVFRSGLEAAPSQVSNPSAESRGP